MDNESNTGIGTDEELVEGMGDIEVEEAGEDEGGEEIDMAAEAEEEATPEPKGAAPVKASEAGKPPAKKAEQSRIRAWEAFTAGVEAHLAAEGIVVKREEQKGFIKYYNPETQQKLYVAKQDRAVSRVETTMDLVGVIDGARPWKGKVEGKGNGKIATALEPTTEVVAEALRLLATDSTPLRAANRPAAKAK